MRHSLKDYFTFERMGALVPPQSVFALAALTVVFAVPAGLIVRALEPDLVLPALALLLFCGAALTVLLAASVKSARNPKELTMWDIAGGLAITGCAASVLSEPDQVTLLFEHLFERDPNIQQE
ncbi:MAG TPA: hypothetical protein VGC86_08830 [Afipia sp.]